MTILPNPSVAAIIRRSRRRPFACAWDSPPPPRPGAPGRAAPRPAPAIDEPPAPPRVPVYLAAPMANAERGEQPFPLALFADDIEAANEPYDHAERRAA
jgi:hypothetical protein